MKEVADDNNSRSCVLLGGLSGAINLELKAYTGRVYLLKTHLNFQCTHVGFHYLLIYQDMHPSVDIIESTLSLA